MTSSSISPSSTALKRERQQICSDLIPLKSHNRQLICPLPMETSNQFGNNHFFDERHPWIWISRPNSSPFHNSDCPLATGRAVVTWLGWLATPPWPYLFCTVEEMSNHCVYSWEGGRRNGTMLLLAIELNCNTRETGPEPWISPWTKVIHSSITPSFRNRWDSDSVSPSAPWVRL